ncbi:MAG: hypothetical protein ACOCWQ_02605, partial [Nanoarchaeota archaeon]
MDQRLQEQIANLEECVRVFEGYKSRRIALLQQKRNEVLAQITEIERPFAYKNSCGLFDGEEDEQGQV